MQWNQKIPLALTVVFFVSIFLIETAYAKSPCIPVPDSYIASFDKGVLIDSFYTENTETTDNCRDSITVSDSIETADALFKKVAQTFNQSIGTGVYEISTHCTRIDHDTNICSPTRSKFQILSSDPADIEKYRQNVLTAARDLEAKALKIKQKQKLQVALAYFIVIATMLLPFIVVRLVRSHKLLFYVSAIVLQLIVLIEISSFADLLFKVPVLPTMSLVILVVIMVEILYVLYRKVRYKTVF